MRKQKPRSNESGSLNDEIDALEQEIANASESASRVGLKKRLAQKKAILIRQERKEGQARREAERAAEAERIRKKKMQDLQMSNEDVHSNARRTESATFPAIASNFRFSGQQQQQRQRLPNPSSRITTARMLCTTSDTATFSTSTTSTVDALSRDSYEARFTMSTYLCIHCSQSFTLEHYFIGSLFQIYINRKATKAYFLGALLAESTLFEHFCGERQT